MLLTTRSLLDARIIKLIFLMAIWCIVTSLTMFIPTVSIWGVNGFINEERGSILIPIKSTIIYCLKGMYVESEDIFRNEL